MIGFTVYSPDMPKRLPIQVLLGGLIKSVGHAVRYWFHYTLVAIAWLGVVPLTTCMCNKRFDLLYSLLSLIVCKQSIL